MKIRQSSPLPQQLNRSALQIAAFYLLLGGLWIVLSDKAAAAIALDEDMLATISLYKGWGYVLITALLLYWLIQRSTAALRASQAQLQQVTDALPVLISYVDADGRYRFMNRTYQEWFGTTALGKTVEEVLGQQAYQAIAHHIDQVLRGTAVSYETVLSYPQGERSVHASYIPDKAPDGQVRGFFALVQDVTESKKAKEEIRQWADAFNGCAHGIAIGDPKSNQVAVCNPAFARLHGGSVEDIVGAPILSLYSPADHESVRQNIERSDQLGQTRFEAHMIRRDGSAFPVQIDLVSVLGEKGELLYRVATAQDISERKRAEEESKSLARFPAENPNPVLRASHDGKIIYANAASEPLLADWRCQVGDRLPPDWLGWIEETIDTGRRKTIDVQCRTTTYSILIAPVPDTNYVNLYGRDITERKQAEDALIESNIQFRTLFEASPDANLLIDPRGNWPILDCNTAACEMNGYTHEELIGQPIDILNVNPLPSVDLDPYLEKIRRAGVLRYEAVHRRKDGTEFPIEVSTSLISLSGRDVLLGIDRDITERKRAEEAKQLERARWQGIVEGIADEVWMCDAQGKMSLLNLASLTAMGLGMFKDKSVEEVYQEVDIFYPDGQPRPPEQAPLLRSLRGEVVRGEEIMQHRQTGKSRYRQFSSAPTRDADGAITGAVAIVRDITDQKIAEEGLRRFELLSEHSRDIILFVKREDGQILECNAAAVRTYGYSREELRGRTILDLRVNDLHLTADQMAQADTRGILFETVHRRRDGTTFPVEVSSQGATIGGVRTLISVVRDISERKRAERALRESQVRLNFALEKSHTGGWDLDLADHTALRTLEHDRIFGYESLLPEWTYEIFLDHVIPEDRAEVDRLFQEAIAAQTDWSFECRIRRIDGEIRWIWATGGHLFDDAGSAYRMAGIVQDITERKRAEQEIRALNERLEQRVIERTAQLQAANKELEAFSYSVSHDLRAPLRAIDGYTRILAEDYEGVLDAEGKRVCSVISAEARRMGQLIDDLLALSRLGRKEMYASRVDMKALAQSVFDDLIRKEDRGRLDVQVAKLPNVQADPSLLRQVWVNLLSNAIKFTSKKEHASIRVGSKQSPDEYVYYVRDTGAGFDMEYVDKLFGVFQRLHGESEFEGTGVGLAIVQRIIRRHGGRVWAEGEPGKGATFYFALPKPAADQHG